MTTYAIGDIQACYSSLRTLLDKLHFDPAQDQLWFAGDLVNRGPQSLETLRFVRDLGSSAVTVLGNHDIHLIASAHRLEKPRKKDTFDALWKADDFEELIYWLRQQPLLHRDENHCMVHAGLAPQWPIQQAAELAEEVHQILRGEEYGEFLDNLYGNEPDQWGENLDQWSRLRYITNCLTRIRFCHEDGKLDFDFKCRLGEQPHHLIPWFNHPQFIQQQHKETIIFGHWSTLGLTQQNGVVCLDTGCLWGGTLTAIDLNTSDITEVDCPCTQQPK